MPTKTPSPEPALIFTCSHGEPVIGDAVTPICDECHEPLRVGYTTFRCTTDGCERNRVAIKPRHQPKPLCPVCCRECTTS